MDSPAVSENRSAPPLKAGVTIAVIVPVFKHSMLLVEALESATAQTIDSAYAVVIVNDGCPFVETHLNGLSCATAIRVPEIYYLKQENKGLSGARNTGIDFALSTFPDLEGIYFLDADNRLLPHAIDNMLKALSCHPAADWFYPDVITFGDANDNSFAGPYSLIANAVQNICEAGSLVRKRLFETGLRFDESMRLGYEDWDFWLSAAEAGHHGLHSPDLPFRYRKRPESMVRNSDRAQGQIKNYLRQKHAWLDSPRQLYRIFARSSYRYAVISGTDCYYCNDPRQLDRPMPVSDLLLALQKWFVRPTEFDFPEFILVTRPATMNATGELKLLNWVVWDLEQRLRSCPVVSCALMQSSSDDSLVEIRPASSGCLDQGHFLMLRSKTLGEIASGVSLDWYNEAVLGKNSREPAIRDLLVSVATLEACVSAEPVLRSFIVEAMALRMRDVYSLYRSRRHEAALDKSTLFRAVSNLVEGRVVFPYMNAAAGIDIAFVCPLVDFGGVERVTIQVARALRLFGMRPHLVCASTQAMRMADELSSVFETISWLPYDAMLECSGIPYLGTRMSNWQDWDERWNAVGLLSQFDAVVNCHSPGLHVIAGDLRKLGIVCLDYQHVLEYSPAGMPQGHPMLSLAYNFVYEYLVTCSNGLSDWFKSQGIPAEKICTLVNGPGIDIDYRVAADIAAKRSARFGSRNLGEGDPLRVMFLGRLDYQKGIDRLRALLDATAGSPRIKWRIIGKPVMNDDVAQVEAIRNVETPLYKSDEIGEALAWADVLVVPSRFEGLPLTIVEAMTFGTVVIATDVGAIAEIVESGHNGYLIEQGEYVETALELLSRFVNEPAVLVGMSAAAHETGMRLRWDGRVAPLAAAIAAAVAKRSLPQLAGKTALTPLQAAPAPPRW